MPLTMHPHTSMAACVQPWHLKSIEGTQCNALDLWVVGMQLQVPHLCVTHIHVLYVHRTCTPMEHRNAMTPVGLEPTIPGSVGRCLIHWATGPSSENLNANFLTHIRRCATLVRHVYLVCA